MKNQCPLDICKRTMKMQTRIILTSCCVMVMFNNFGTSVEVSSKIDLDSNENEEALGDSTFDTIVNSKKFANPPESILRAPKPSTFIRRHGSGLIKASETRKRRIYPSHVRNRRYKK